MTALARAPLHPRRPPLKRLLAGPGATLTRGTARGPDGALKRCVVTLDAPSFDRIAMLAAVSRVSFAEAVRQLLILGLQAHEDKP